MKKRNFFTSLLLLTAAFFLLSRQERLGADYASELRSQIREIQGRNTQGLNFDYFHDMGILARKADEAELNDLTAETVHSLLLKKMEEYVQSEIKAINELYESDRYQASRRLEALNQFKRFYEPTGDYLNTTGGQAIHADMIRFRADALAVLEKSCSSETLATGLQAVLKTGLFVTNSAEEIKALQALPPKIECCLSWAPQLSFRDEQSFKSTYEEGKLTYEAHLKLETSRRDYSDAKWVGDWIQHFDGRDGQGEATAQVILQYPKGAETAELAISASRVTSVGRINFPVTLAGEKRTLEIEGKPLAPKVLFSAGHPVSLTGCHNEKK